MKADLTVYLDMDGVLANFVSAALEIHNAPKDMKVTEYSLWNLLGIEERVFWRAIDKYVFWGFLPPYPWYKDLYLALTNMVKHVYIVTDPRSGCCCHDAKTVWLDKWLDIDKNNIIFTKHKYLLANEKTVLIDDNVSNCKAFVSAGGKALIFPQEWNCAATDKIDRVAWVEKTMQTIIGRMGTPPTYSQT